MSSAYKELVTFYVTEFLKIISFVYFKESLGDIEDASSQGPGGQSNKDNIDIMLTKNIDDEVLGMLDQKTMQDFISLMGSDHALPSTSTTTGKCHTLSLTMY